MLTRRFGLSFLSVCVWVAINAGASADQRFCFQRGDDVVVTTGTAGKPLKVIQKRTDPAISPDGTVVAVTKTDAAGNRSIWLESVDGKSHVRVEDGHARGAYGALWSGDGAQIAFNVFDGHHWSVGITDSHGANFRRFRANPSADKDYFVTGWNLKTEEPLVGDLDQIYQVAADGSVSWKKSVTELLGPVETAGYSMASDSRLYITPDGSHLVLNVLDEKGEGDDGPPACVLVADTQSWTLNRVAKQTLDPHELWISADGKFLLFTSMDPKSRNPVGSIYRWDLEKNTGVRLFRNATAPSASQ